MLTNPYVTSVENEIHRREWRTVRGRQGHASVGGSRRVVPQLTLRDTGVALAPAGLWHGWSDQTTADCLVNYSRRSRSSQEIGPDDVQRRTPRERRDDSQVGDIAS